MRLFPRTLALPDLEPALPAVVRDPELDAAQPNAVNAPRLGYRNRTDGAVPIVTVSCHSAWLRLMCGAPIGRQFAAEC